MRPKYKWFHLAEITEIVRSPCSSPRSHLRPTFKTPLRDLRERCNVFPELTPMVGFSHIESIWDSRCTTLPARSLSLMCSEHHSPTSSSPSPPSPSQDDHKNLRLFSSTIDFLLSNSSSACLHVIVHQTKRRKLLAHLHKNQQLNRFSWCCLFLHWSM